MDKIRIKHNDANAEPMWISKKWYDEDNVSEMWTSDPALAKVWDLHITNLGRVLASILITHINERPVEDLESKGAKKYVMYVTRVNHDHHVDTILSILRDCRIERIERTTKYKVIQSF